MEKSVYIKERLAFAKQNLNLEWGRVIFCGQTQINGIGVMGLMTEYGLGKLVLTDYINTSAQYVNEVRKMVARVVHQRDDFIFAKEKSGFQLSEEFLEWMHNETNFVALNLPLRSHKISPLNHVWEKLRRRFEGLSLSRLAMEGEIVNYWYMLQEDDFVQDLYDGMKSIMCEVIMQSGSLDVDHKPN